MKEKIRIAAVLAAVAAVLALAACSDDAVETDGRDQRTTTTVVHQTDTTAITENTTAGSTAMTAESTLSTATATKTSARPTAVTATKTKATADSDPFRTKSGDKYVPAGYSSYAGGKFTLNEELSLTFDGNAFAQDFNRLSLTYSATGPLMCRITYVQGQMRKNEEFFLEEGEGTFRLLIGDYLTGKTGRRIQKLTVSSAEKEDVRFALKDLTTEVYEVFNSDTYYLENAKYKFGIRLIWGGGINYIEDKTDGLFSLGNLINQHDTGRLIQQSYYGTGMNGKYKPGTFNGNLWAYNPVQGGDQYGNHSRLIDVVIQPNSVYIKCQPQDWSLDGEITPSYMENTYTLYEDRIEVSNRFVDFSGWRHPYSTQEIPAFYTVSYLNTFKYYAGSNSWNGAPLSTEPSLPFWGGSDHNSCIFPIQNSNTETWCCWVNGSTDFGIGLFVPNADQFLAGRNAYNGSSDPNNGACNYVAPLVQKQIVTYQPIEYSYLIATGKTNEIRAVFAAHKDFAANLSLHTNHKSLRIPDVDMRSIDFSASGSAALMKALHSCAVSYDSGKRALKLTCTGTDPYAAVDYTAAGLQAADYSKIRLEYMIPTSNAKSAYGCELFLCAGNTVNPTAGKSVESRLICDSEYHTLEIDVGHLAFWNGDIHQIRLDFFNDAESGDVMFVKSLKLIK